MNKQIYAILIIVVIAFGGSGIAKSYSGPGNPATIIENINIDTVNINVEQGESPILAMEDSIEELTDGRKVGAYGDTNLTNLVLSGDLDVGDELTLDDATMTCFDMVFADATTTPVAIAGTSIFSSGSSTIFGFTYGQTGVSTSTIAVDCGVAADAFTSSDTLIDGISTATSTISYLAGGYGTNGKINQIIGPNQYITCTITGDITTGITNTGNTYAGTATVCAYQ